jgi:hypothetical protein
MWNSIVSTCISKSTAAPARNCPFNSTVLLESRSGLTQPTVQVSPMRTGGSRKSASSRLPAFDHGPAWSVVSPALGCLGFDAGFRVGAAAGLNCRRVHGFGSTGSGELLRKQSHHSHAAPIGRLMRSTRANTAGSSFYSPRDASSHPAKPGDKKGHRQPQESRLVVQLDHVIPAGSDALSPLPRYRYNGRSVVA